jgi:phosphoribosyl 1,2-cyclic phosphodiesterase
VQYAKRKVDLTKLDGILLSHKHLDHASDVNVMVEGMTDGGFRHRGTLFCPGDALEPDAVVLRYLRGFPEQIVELEPLTEYRVGGIEFRTSRPHPHNFVDRPGVETYGFVFGQGKLGWVTDTRYYDGIVEDHQAEVMVLHTVVEKSRVELPHLGVDDAERIIKEAEPQRAMITHFGTAVWRAHPWEVAARLSDRTGIEVRAARDGMRLDLDADADGARSATSG